MIQCSTLCSPGSMKSAYPSGCRPLMALSCSSSAIFSRRLAPCYVASCDISHFSDFCEHYEEKYAETYGMYRLERIQKFGHRFATCGDYLQGVARIRCTNPECGHDYFQRGRPVPSRARERSCSTPPTPSISIRTSTCLTRSTSLRSSLSPYRRSAFC